MLQQHESPGQLTAWPEGNSLWLNQLSGLVCDPRVQGWNPFQDSVTFWRGLRVGLSAPPKPCLLHFGGSTEILDTSSEIYLLRYSGEMRLQRYDWYTEILVV